MYIAMYWLYVICRVSFVKPWPACVHHLLKLSNSLICPHVCTHTELVYKNNMTESEESSVNDKGRYLTKEYANQCFFVE